MVSYDGEAPWWCRWMVKTVVEEQKRATSFHMSSGNGGHGVESRGGGTRNWWSYICTGGGRENWQWCRYVDGGALKGPVDGTTAMSGGVQIIGEWNEGWRGTERVDLVWRRTLYHPTDHTTTPRHGINYLPIREPTCRTLSPPPAPPPSLLPAPKRLHTSYLPSEFISINQGNYLLSNIRRSINKIPRSIKVPTPVH